MAVAVAAVVAGVIVAIVSSGAGHSGTKSARAQAQASRARGTAKVDVAADYLGLTRTQLLGELREGRSLAQIAAATGGKSTTGLVEALVSARAAQLDAKVKTDKLSPAAERKRLARLRRRLTAELERVPGYSALPQSAQYLGISVTELRADLRAGRSLAQIADATPGKSSSGLIEARVGAREATLEAALASGKISATVERELTSDLRKRITSEVERKPTP